jgi:light-regulated signal transduction histidine kinase (bacteriophytochrome)
MSELIEDMLALSRVGRAELQHAAVDLSEIARIVADELSRREPQRRIDWDIEPGLSAWADHRLLQIVFENLLGNAWKFTANNAAASIALHSEQQDSETVYYVRDNGAGFDMNYAHKLFAPFARLHSASDFPGTGIGLATVKRIIDRHSGRVWVKAAVGAGTTIYFTLPPVKSGSRQ